MQYHPQSKLRTVICLTLVAILHIAVIASFRHRNSFADNPPAIVSIVRIIFDKPLLKTQRPVERASRSVISVATPRAEKLPAPQPVLQVSPESSAPEMRLDLDALREQAVQHEIKRERSPLELQNEAALKNHSIESTVESAAARAQHTDCLTAHSEHGLFAPIFIAADLLRDKGCKF